MALLWGNGRLLNGLLDYYEKNRDPAVLESCVRLAGFLTGITEKCIRPEVIEEFRKKGATGFICFTQNIEGLVKLFHATGNRSYLDLAEKIYPLLPERGNQHSHGYLNTLRGILMLYRVTQKGEQLEFVTSRYRQLLESDDYLVSGGVPEFFGSTRSPEGFRDEGCSQADWLMLSLELWETTGETHYLDQGEYCLMNALMCNQFDSGDFGHHHLDSRIGYVLSKNSEGRAWWCCNYHGLQALLEARNRIVTGEGGRIYVHLFYETAYRDDHLGFRFGRLNGRRPAFGLTVERAAAEEVAVNIRKPYWAEKMTLRLNGQPVDAPEEKGYISIRRRWSSGDRLGIDLDYAFLVKTRDGKTTRLDDAAGNLSDVALQYGPYLLSIDDGLMPSFMAEPSEGNSLIVPNLPSRHPDDKLAAYLPEQSNLTDCYLVFPYRHEGFYDINHVVIRPLSEISHQRPANVRVWMNLELADGK